MKKFLSLIMVCVLIFSLAGCKKDSSVSDTSGNSSVLDNGTSKENQDSSEQENASSDQAESNDEASSAASSVVSGGSLNSGTSQPSVITPSKKVDLTADTSRAPSTDVATAFSDGYLYYGATTYGSVSGSVPGVYRKKISSDPETINSAPERVTDKSATTVKVLNGKIYYMSPSQNLYRCDIDGKNIITLDDSGLVTSFEVAGNWAFVTRTLRSTSIVHMDHTEELYVISTDGSQIHQIKPNEPKIIGSRVKFYGFNRGYCYLAIRYNFIPVDAPSSSYNYWRYHSVRIDYRSEKITQCELETSGKYTYDGTLNYFNELDTYSIYYDCLYFRAHKMTMAVSLSNFTAAKLKDDSPRLCRLRDYYVYVESDSSKKDGNIYFIDLKGNTKVVEFDPTENGKYNYCGPRSVQDIHSNQLIYDRALSDGSGGEWLIITPEGEISVCYRYNNN